MTAPKDNSALAAYKAFRSDLAWVLVGAFLLTLVLNYLDWGTDATDLNGWNRSGLALRTDYGTGCQYLEAHSGGVTPRLAADGSPICVGGFR